MESIRLLCNEIGMKPETMEKILAVMPPMNELKRLYELLQEDQERFFEENSKVENAPLWYLALMTGFASLCRSEYVRRGIDNEVFKATMYDLVRWEDAYFEQTGKVGLNEKRWLSNHVQLKLFQLGELQFEPLESVSFELPEEWKDLPILNVHIPKGANLERRSEAYHKALAFFQKEKAVVVCSSWLLAPWIGESMGKESRIAAFQSEFTFAELHPGSRQAEERLFGPLQDDPSLYEVHTRLQAEAQKRLMNGEKLPGAAGYQLVSR